MSEALAPSNKSEEITNTVSQKKIHRWLWTLLLLAGVLASLLGLHLFSRPAPYYIAVSGPMSGSSASDGQAMVQAIRLHLNEVNQKGGIHGHRVELLVYDDQNKADLAATNAETIAKQTAALAVIGHYSSTASAAAAPIYQEQGLAAVTGSATTDSITRGNDWYFRVIFNNSDQAALLANYIYKVLNKNSATLISTDTVYGTSLAENFHRTAKSIGLEVKQHWKFVQDDDASFNDAIDKLLKYYGDAKEDSVLFVATHSAQAASIITALRSLGNRVAVVGADSLASTSFRKRLAELPQERAKPGYYTNGILATMPFLPDIAGQQAQRFYQDFIQAYGEEPSSAGTMYYDAALTVTRALTAINTQDPLAKQRKQLQEGLWNISDVKSGVEGVSGFIYFDRNGDAVKNIPIAVFKNGKAIAAQEQFQSIADLNNIPNLLEEAVNNQIIFVNEKFMRRAQVVYVGIDFNEISEINAIKGHYSADFYLWFRYLKNYEDKALEFINSADPLKLAMEPVLAQASSVGGSGVITHTYRVNSQFKVNFDFADYPLDKQQLQIKFRHKDLTRDHLIYVVDTLGFNTTLQGLLEKFKRNNIFNAGGWRLNHISFYQSSSKTDSTLGLPELFGAEQRIEYSQFNAELEISRNFLSFVLKNLLPVIFVVMLGYFVFYIPVAGAGFAVRITLSVNMILSTSLFHIRMASSMPDIDYLILIEYVFYMVYMLAIFNMLFTVFRQLKASGNEQDQIWVERIDFIGMLTYPAIIVAVLLILVFPHL